jgi:hypothetical protein
MQKLLRLIAAPLAFALACSTVGCTIYGEKKPPTLASTTSAEQYERILWQTVQKQQWNKILTPLFNDAQSGMPMASHSFFPHQPPRLVRPSQARSPLASHPRPLRHLGLRDHAATDPRRRRPRPLRQAWMALSQPSKRSPGVREEVLAALERPRLLPPRPHFCIREQSRRREHVGQAASNQQPNSALLPGIGAYTSAAIASIAFGEAGRRGRRQRRTRSPPPDLAPQKRSTGKAKAHSALNASEIQAARRPAH